jgi:hypothetical protein
LPGKKVPEFSRKNKLKMSPITKFTKGKSWIQKL